MSLLKELTVPLFFSLVLALAAFALIVTECVLISRVSKKNPRAGRRGSFAGDRADGLGAGGNLRMLDGGIPAV